MKELKKQHLEMLQLLESIEVMLQNGNSIHPNSVIRGAIQTAIGMEVNVTNVNDKCDNKQTAVEWLVEEFTKTNHLTEDEFYMKFEQAKAMEKEQIENVFDIVWKRANETKDKFYTTAKDNGFNYYNETFKSE